MLNGGTENFVMNYYRHIDREKVQFDFLASVDKPGYFDDEIKKLGGRIFHAYPLAKNPIKNYLSIAEIVRENGYQIVHRHTGSAFGYFDLRAARHGGAKYLILHSHNNLAGKPWLHRLSKWLLSFDCIKFSCARPSGQFLFGKNAEFQLINNGIEVASYAFNAKARASFRKSLGLEGKFVVGNVGRLSKQKNHPFLLDVMAQLVKVRPDSMLVCVGAGEERTEIENKIHSMNLERNVMLLGNRSDVATILNAFDVFVLPSLYEGFPIVLVEAQSNGLKCIVSAEACPAESNVTGNVQFISLKQPPEYWAGAILNASGQHDPLAASAVARAGYDIADCAKKLADYYLNLSGE